MMNILFLTKSFGVGGVEVVTVALAKALVARGYRVSIFAFLQSDHVLDQRLPDNVPLHIGCGYKVSKENVSLLHEILLKEKIDIVINQWGMPFIPIRVINKARKGLNVKVISVYHSQVNTNARIKTVEIALQHKHHFIQRLMLNIKLKVFQYITSASMKYVYAHSDIFEVLSPSFIELFKHFVREKNPQKLMVQTNPITIETSSKYDLYAGKNKEIIFVGRLESVVKRVDRVLEVWNYLEKQFPDWQLTIVGDGEDKKKLEGQVRDLKLNCVSFVGFQQPLEYYKRASILLLTSEFEGFPLVLPECMSFGVIPAVYNSFVAVNDIIKDKYNGLLFPYHEDGFRAEEAASLLSSIMGNNSLRNEMSKAAMETSKRFAMDKICSDWERTFKRLKNINQ